MTNEEITKNKKTDSYMVLPMGTHDGHIEPRSFGHVVPLNQT